MTTSSSCTIHMTIHWPPPTAAFFSVGLTFLNCISRNATVRLCPSRAWEWASAECILKLHLAECVVGRKGGGGPSPPQGGLIFALPQHASRENPLYRPSQPVLELPD